VQESNESLGDVLSMYVKLPMDPGMSEQQKTEFLRDTAVGFIFAGKDLIAVTLTWFFYMMCKHPNVEARILEELRDLQSSTWSGDFSVFECDMLRSATYLQAALLETLRCDIFNLLHLSPGYVGNKSMCLNLNHLADWSYIC
jgi:cytochrome P450